MNSSSNQSTIALLQAKTIKNWTKIATIFSGAYITLALLAPILMSTNLHQIGQLLYRIYSAVCHQDASRSWFFPTNHLGSSPTILPSLQVTFPNSVAACLECSTFIGAPEIGWKTALCHRCTAIYLGVFVASLIYHLLKSKNIRVPRLTTFLYLIIGLSPILIDTVRLTDSITVFATSTIHLSHIPSTLTGGLFGTLSIWYAYPQIDTHCQKYI